MRVFGLLFKTKGLESFWLRNPRILCELGCNFSWEYFPYEQHTHQNASQPPCPEHPRGIWFCDDTIWVSQGSTP